MLYTTTNMGVCACRALWSILPSCIASCITTCLRADGFLEEPKNVVSYPTEFQFWGCVFLFFERKINKGQALFMDRYPQLDVLVSAVKKFPQATLEVLVQVALDLFSWLLGVAIFCLLCCQISHCPSWCLVSFSVKASDKGVTDSDFFILSSNIFLEMSSSANEFFYRWKELKGKECGSAFLQHFSLLLSIYLMPQLPWNYSNIATYCSID